MKSLFTLEGSNEIVERINKLSAATPSQWGKMNVTQMLAHCQQPLHVAFGELRIKRGLIGILFSGYLKKKFSGDEPFKKNLPTARNFIVANPGEFEMEKLKLISLVKRFSSAGPTSLSKNLHPFFGKLTADEWDRLSWKHLDHHLQQFGA